MPNAFKSRVLPHAVLHIDDDPRFLKSTKQLFEDLPIICKVDSRQAVRFLKQNMKSIGLVLMDLQMPTLNGVAASEIVKKLNPYLPVVFYSAHSTENLWVKSLGKLKFDYDLLRKPLPPTDSKPYYDVIKLFQARTTEYCEKIAEPFKLTAEQYLNLPFQTKLELLDTVDLLHRGFLEDFFEINQDTDWVVIGKSYCNVMASGAGCDEPDDEFLTELANNIDGPVYLVSRDRKVEEISSWPERNQKNNDHYPSLSFKVNECVCTFDFDTGSDSSFVDDRHLHSLGVTVSNKHLRKTSVWGRKITYSKQNIDVQIYAESAPKKRNIVLYALVVRDWGKSPLVKNYSDRVGLIGRDFLNKNQLSVLLDGTNKESRFL